MPQLSDYLYAITMDEFLLEAIHHLEEVRHTSSRLKQGVHLKMASLAMTAAMQIYVDQPKEKESDSLSHSL